MKLNLTRDQVVQDHYGQIKHIDLREDWIRQDIELRRMNSCIDSALAEMHKHKECDMALQIMLENNLISKELYEQWLGESNDEPAHPAGGEK